MHVGPYIVLSLNPCFAPPLHILAAEITPDAVRIDQKSLAQRKPNLAFRFVGLNPMRIAARRGTRMLSHEAPRNTRESPLEGPFGFREGLSL